MNELVPSLLLGKPKPEFYLNRLLKEILKSKNDEFLQDVLYKVGGTQKRFLAYLLLMILVAK